MFGIKKIAESEYSFSLLNKISSILTGLITSSLINRYLGVEGKGQYVYLINLAYIVVIIGNLGFVQSYSKSKRNNLSNNQKKYADVFVAQFVLYSFLALIISLIVKWDALYTAILFLIPVQICSQQFSKIILADYYFFFQKTRFYFLFLELLSICVVCVFFPRSSVFLVALLTLKDLALIIIYLIKIRYSFKDFSIEIPFIKMLLKFGFVAMMTELLITFNYKLDLIMLKWYVDDVQLGLYSVGIALAEYIWIIPDAFKDVIYFKTSNSNAIKDILTSIRVNLLVSIVAMLGMVFLGYPFIYIMYGTDFLGSHIVTCVALLGVPAMIIYKLTNYLYLANGKQLFYFLSLCVSVFSNMLFNLLLIPYMGKIGAALASSLAYNICGLCFLIKFLRDYSIPWVEIVKFSKNDLFFLVGKIKK